VDDRNGAATPRAMRTCIGPLASHLDRFLARLVREGYAPSSLQAQYDMLAQLSGWLEDLKIPLMKLDEERLEQFLVSHRRRGHATTGRQMLVYLRDMGCLPVPAEQVDQTALGCLLRDFERFLISERGLSRCSVTNYLPIARRFLIDRFGSQALRLDALCQQDVNRFVLHHAQKGTRSQAKGMVTALRSFLRFLHERGATSINLAAAVPGVADWRLSHLPKSLPPELVAKMLSACDLNTASGQRDYAILLLLARLGLRAGEVVALTLDDLDWEKGEIIIRGKGQRLARLPMPTEVGAALVRYLRHVRPTCATRRVFIRMVAPCRGLAGPSAICCIVYRVLKRAGLEPEFKGSHLLRHSFASDLLRRGASLTEIGQLLRHSELNTTQIYAKVDIAALRTIALPWPGEAP